VAITDKELNAESAAEIVVSMDGGREVGILDEQGDIAMTTGDKHLARAIAARLVELSELLPEPPRLLRRDEDANDFFRHLES
jgi:hypothetical protein